MRRGRGKLAGKGRSFLFNMPIYSYTCWNCENEQEEYKRLVDRLNGPICTKCGHKTTFTISPGPKPTDHLYPRVVENFGAEPVVINSLKHYKEEQKKRGLVDNGKPRGVRGKWV
jgi:DNA-directed RNA polymerase subunit RPC12/RpoP